MRPSLLEPEGIGRELEILIERILRRHAFAGLVINNLIRAVRKFIYPVNDARKHVLLGHVSLVDQVRTIFAPRPYAGALSPDGKLLFVSGGLGRSIFVVDVARRKVARAVDDVGQLPRGIAVAGDGKRLYTANGPSNDVSIVDVAAGKVVKRVAVGGGPWGVVVAP